MFRSVKNQKYLFGPVPSRRLGRSLGVDIIPHRICTMNCAYCEVGKTTECVTKRRHFDPADEILAEFYEQYPQLAEGLDVVTVTGAGEPTLNLDLGYIIDGVKKISRHPVAVLTNSSLMTDPDVCDELSRADIVVPSIDAATPEVYRKICAPHRDIDIYKVNRALTDFSNRYSGRLLIEVLLCEGINDSPEELGRIAEVISGCRYEVVQLNTVHRPPAFSRAKAVDEKTLLDTAILFRSKGLRVEPAGNYLKSVTGGSLTADSLIRLLRMRPCSLKDIIMVSGADEKDVRRILSDINSHLKINKHNGEKFYFAG
jgi:wyosine [tRNA(Phe)-imidazoG37] synthetase (radical SAM superfamily)